MPASLMTLPYELREQILLPIVKVEGTIQLQYPIWADNMKSVFVPPIAQVCEDLREEVFQFFYRTNVFVWKIDPEVRDWGAGTEPVDPSTFPLKMDHDDTKGYGPRGPLVSSLPWRYPNMLVNLRHIRLNIHLPPQHNVDFWTGRFGKRLANFVTAVEHGQKLKSLKILVGSWHKIRELEQPQLDALSVLEQMQVRGVVQVRTMSLDDRGKTVVQGLDLERRMRATISAGQQIDFEEGKQAGGRHLDWEWEGGVNVQQLS